MLRFNIKANEKSPNSKAFYDLFKYTNCGKRFCQYLTFGSRGQPPYKSDSDWLKILFPKINIVHKSCLQKSSRINVYFRTGWMHHTILKIRSISGILSFWSDKVPVLPHKSNHQESFKSQNPAESSSDGEIPQKSKKV